MKKIYLVIGLLLLATALRFWMLDAQSFWNDEGNSARLSERSIPLIIEGTASDIHPPLYYIILHGWRELLGDSEFGLRAFSAFAGVGVVAVTFALGRQLFTGRKKRFILAALATFLAATNPALIYYSQETRMYALLAFWAVLSTLLLWRLPQGSRPVPVALAYVAVSAAGLYTHYSYPAVLFWQNLVVLLWLALTARKTRHRPVRPFLAWCGLMALTFLAYQPWLPIYLRQVGDRPGGISLLSFLDFIGPAGRFLVMGEALPQTLLAPVSWIGIGLIFLGILGGGRDLLSRRQAVIWPATALAVPVLGLFFPILAVALVGATAPALYKFLVIAVPFFCLLAGAGIVFGGGFFFTGEKSGQINRWAGVKYLLLGLFFIIVAYAQPLNNMYTNPDYARADYRGVAAQIVAEDYPNAGIILNAANQWEVFTYYHKDGAPVYPLPTGRPDADRIAAELEQITAAHDRLYVLFWGEAERDPQRLVERWLDAHTFKAREEWVGDVRFVTYEVPGDPAGLPETSAAIRFGPNLTLTGYTVSPGSFRGGDIVPVTLFWETDAALETRYKVFIHLLDSRGNIIAQRDSEPGGGLALTTTWPAGESIVDNHGLLIPQGTPPGRYALITGLYDIADPTNRLLTPEGNDSIQLATIEIR